MTEGQLIFPDDAINQTLSTAYQNLREGAFAEAVAALERVLEMDVEYPGAASVLKCEQITTLPRADIHEPALGRPLSPVLLRAVERAVLRAIGVPVPLEAS